ncbi:hypothetical protein M0R45_034440 [Rubus argutus]|uniref:Uncharacterized protein n=1 Tax=Rubus argutus TaxID=59490 RepID=A0AAW1VTT4_RUBAR
MPFSSVAVRMGAAPTGLGAGGAEDRGSPSRLRASITVKRRRLGMVHGQQRSSAGLGIAKQPWVAAVERCGGALIEAMVAW